MNTSVPQTGLRVSIDPRASKLIISNEASPASPSLASLPSVKIRPAPLAQLPPVKNRRRALLLHFGSITVRLLKTSWYSKRHRKKYFSHTLAWRDIHGKRRREKRSTLELAKKRAAAIAQDIQTGEAVLGNFGQAQRASLARAQELLAKIGSPPLELVIGIYTDLVQKLSGRGTPQQAVDFFLEHLPRGVAPKTIPQLVTELIEAKRANTRSEKWLTTLEQQLGRFAQRFTGHLQAVQGHEISTWLDGLKNKKGEPLGLWTRGNYRAAVVELVRFGQGKGQLSKSWDELQHVEDPEPPPVDVEIYTPTQLDKLLTHTRPNMIPFTALTAFAGVRHEEMSRRDSTSPVLDWSDIKFDRKVIVIRQTVGKIKKRRLIHMHPNLIAWLRPHAKLEGSVCADIKNPSNALVQAKRRAGLPSARGELTNALRSSFISYRLSETNDIGLTAREAGNSAQMIAQHYLELADPDQAARYFAVSPRHAANVVQLNLGII